MYVHGRIYPQTTPTTLTLLTIQITINFEPRSPDAHLPSILPEIQVTLDGHGPPGMELETMGDFWGRVARTLSDNIGTLLADAIERSLD